MVFRNLFLPSDSFHSDSYRNMLYIKLHNKPKLHKLKEAPLGDIYDFDYTTPNSPGEKDSFSSLAYGNSTNEEYKAEAKLLWRDTVHNWYIINLKSIHSRYYPNFSSELKDFIKSKNIPKGSKILVSTSSQIPGDFESAGWQTAHDIIGHAMLLRRNLYVVLQTSNIILPKKIHDPFVLTDFIHRQLPEKFRIAEPTDSFPDILFAIFAGAFDKQKILPKLIDFTIQFLNPDERTEEKIEGMKKNCEFIIDLFLKTVSEFIESIPFDKPTLINSFNN